MKMPEELRCNLDLAARHTVAARVCLRAAAAAATRHQVRREQELQRATAVVRAVENQAWEVVVK